MFQASASTPPGRRTRAISAIATAWSNQWKDCPHTTTFDRARGDEIRFAQTRNADGTYTVTKIQLVIPSVAGQVTAVDGSTITVKRLDGTTETIHVDASTAYTVAGVTTATLADIKVGDFIVAQGTQRADGSLDAAAVHSGFEKRFGRHGDGPNGHGDGPNGPADPDKAAPSAAPSGTPG